MMPVRRPPWDRGRSPDDVLLSREWLVTNALGGYASGTVAGAVTRRYHGLLVAALPAPLGRVVMLNHLWEEVRLPDGSRVALGGRERIGEVLLPAARVLREFRLEAGLPVWTFEIGDFVIEKRALMVHQQNSAIVRYRVLAGDQPLRLRFRPSVHFRPHEDPVSTPLFQSYQIRIEQQRYSIIGDPRFPELHLRAYGIGAVPNFVAAAETWEQLVYRVEAGRGYEAHGPLWSPGYFRADVEPEGELALAASVEPWEAIAALDPGSASQAEAQRRQRALQGAPPEARDGVAAELVLAADQFIFTPSGRAEDLARARAAGEELRTVIAGYHWFTDWGRDTMISLEGLALCTGRASEAAWVLRTFARYVRDGLIPNMFPDHSSDGLYHTADATLWFFHALQRYLEYTNDFQTVRELLPTMQSIVDHHLRGTRFGIRIDPDDGLFRQGADGYQLTWMDAKVDGWVVTPRRGKAVELNALWYNALRLLADWSSRAGDASTATQLEQHAGRAFKSFNERFWCEDCDHLYDVVDGENGDDPACRPNQILSISLDHAVLAHDRWSAVLGVVHSELLTPFGLRSLARGHPDYKPVYDGDLRSRDAAYHQGTVWAWLIGPFIDAWLKVHPDGHEQVRGFLAAFDDHLNEFGVGSIAEIFDAEPPYTPRGCIAQAWSVAEVLRCSNRFRHP